MAKSDTGLCVGRDEDVTDCKQDFEALNQTVKAKSAALKKETEDCPHRCGGVPRTRPLVDTAILTIVGTDDGVTFWTVRGEVMDTMHHTVSANFAPKGGPLEPVNGIYHEKWVDWTVNGTRYRWPQQSGREFGARSPYQQGQPRRRLWPFSQLLLRGFRGCRADDKSCGRGRNLGGRSVHRPQPV